MTITAATDRLLVDALLLRGALTPITCRQCGRHLVDAYAGSIARCPVCQTWSGTTERPRLPRRHSPLDVNHGIAG